MKSYLLGAISAQFIAGELGNDDAEFLRFAVKFGKSYVTRDDYEMRRDLYLETA